LPQRSNCWCWQSLSIVKIRLNPQDLVAGEEPTRLLDVILKILSRRQSTTLKRDGTMVNFSEMLRPNLLGRPSGRTQEQLERCKTFHRAVNCG
jgi:hypothetical protein